MSAASGGRSTSPASSTRAHPVEACLGDWVLVHVGFAMSRIDEAEAARDPANPHRTGRSAGRDRSDAPVGGRIGGRSCPPKAICKSLYPFLHGKQQDAGQLDAALLHSVSEKARKTRGRPAKRFFGEQADVLVAAAKRSPASTATAAGCSPWAMAARAATPRMSRWSSCIRSPPGVRRWPRSIWSPTSR